MVLSGWAAWNGSQAGTAPGASPFRAGPVRLVALVNGGIPRQYGHLNEQNPVWRADLLAWAVAVLGCCVLQLLGVLGVIGQKCRMPTNLP